jgi:hypothetical protein
MRLQLSQMVPGSDVCRGFLGRRMRIHGNAAEPPCPGHRDDAIELPQLQPPRDGTDGEKGVRGGSRNVVIQGHRGGRGGLAHGHPSAGRCLVPAGGEGESGQRRRAAAKPTNNASTNTSVTAGEPTGSATHCLK